MKTVLAVMLLVLTALTVSAQTTAPSVSINTYWAGVYTYDTEKHDGADTSGMSHSTIDYNARHFTTATTTIVVPKNDVVHFGFSYDVNGSPTGANVILNKITSFPAPGFPVNGTPIMQTTNDLQRQVGQRTYFAGFTIDGTAGGFPTGIYTFRLYYNNQLLATQSFNIVAGN